MPSAFSLQENRAVCFQRADDTRIDGLLSQAYLGEEMMA